MPTPIGRAGVERSARTPPRPCAIALIAFLAVGGLCLPDRLAHAAVAPWSSTGPDLGWVTTLLRPKGPTGPLLAGTFGGGVYRSDDDGTTWTEAGTGLGGRFVNVLAADARLNPFTYAGTIDAGVWRTDTTLQRWEGVNRGLGGNAAAPEITGIAVDPSEDRTLLLSSATGMWTSRNWGNDWPDSLRWLANFTTFDAEMPPLASYMHFGLEPYGVWWTTNRGQSLHALNNGLPDALMEDLEIWPTSLDTLVLAAYNAGIYVMRDATQPAATWKYAGITPLPEVHPIMRTLAIAADAGTLLAGSEWGVHATTDLGASWTRLPDGLSHSHPEVWSILVESQSPLRLALGTYTNGFMVSAPGGGDWVQRNLGLRAAWMRQLHAFGDSLLAGTAHGRLYLSPDAGQTWKDRTGSIDELDLFGLLRLPSGRWLVGGNTQVWASDDRGETWRIVGVGIGAGKPLLQLVHPSWLDKDVVYAATVGGLFRSSDQGETFSPVPGLPNTTAVYHTLAAVEGDSTLWTGAFGDDIYRGRDGEPFVAQSMHPAGTSSYRAMAFPVGTSEVVVVGTDGGLTRYDSGVAHDIGGGLPDTAVRALLALPENGDLYVGLLEDGVHRSPNGGGYWEPLLDGLGSHTIESLAVSRGAVPRVHAATLGASVRTRPADDMVPVFFDGVRLLRTGEGVEVTFRWTSLARAATAPPPQGETPTGTDVSGTVAKAAAWWALYRAIGDGPWIQVAEAGGDGEIRVVDRLEGVEQLPGRRLRYRVDLAEGARVIATAVAELVLDGAAPAIVRTRLLPNVPNPFNPRTEARFELARAGEVVLEVVDARGRRVARLLQQSLPAGEYSAIWEGTDDRGHPLASGAYVLRLIADGRTQTRVVTMIR